jgi:hypothetical protein
MRAVRLLPDRAQLLLRRGRATLTGRDWAASVRRLRSAEDPYRDLSSVAGSERQRVLVATPQQSPPWLEVSYGLATALKLRGHQVSGLLCDGWLPLCEMNLGCVERSSCEVCFGWLERYAEAFGFEFSRTSEFIGPSDRSALERVVAATSPTDLADLAFEGVPVGKLAARELQRYHRGFVFDAVSDPAYRSWMVSGALLVRLANRLFDRERPDILVASSGRTLLSACLCTVAKQRGIRVVTWDTEPAHPDGLVFAHDGSASERPLDDAWRVASTEPLTPAQKKELHDYVWRWTKGGIGSQSGPLATDDGHALRSPLQLRPGAPLVAAFTNLAWDMKAVDRDVGFSSMFDWVFGLVEYASTHPQVDLVVRAHPAEVNVSPDLRSRTPVAAEIRRRYPMLPDNVRLVEGGDPSNSYALARAATIVAVYSSRIGLEVALAGKRPWLAGDINYRGKGFTRDVESPRHLIELLDRGSGVEALSSGEIEMAERFAYLWWFRYVTRLPVLRRSDGRFALKSFRDLAPGGDPVIERICDALLNGTPFVDLARLPTVV